MPFFHGGPETCQHKDQATKLGVIQESEKPSDWKGRYDYRLGGRLKKRSRGIDASYCRQQMRDYRRKGQKEEHIGKAKNSRGAFEEK
jgi:hypothetical protein